MRAVTTQMRKLGLEAANAGTLVHAWYRSSRICGAGAGRWSSIEHARLQDYEVLTDTESKTTQ